MKLTPEVAQALANLRGNSDFQVVLQGLREVESKAQDACADGDGLVLYRAQGTVKTLRTFFKAYDDAPEAAKHFKSHR